MYEYKIANLPELLISSLTSYWYMAPAGARTGFDWAWPECLVKSRTGPITGFDRALTRI